MPPDGVGVGMPEELLGIAAEGTSVGTSLGILTGLTVGKLVRLLGD